VETGTYGGTTPALGADLFSKIYTVELHRELFLQGKKNLEKFQKVTLSIIRTEKQMMIELKI
jgi:protein-L-isoaspartate O-methyltransferase